MMRSMTGYGRIQQTVNGMDITIEIKSVNHRYYEFTSRITRGYGFLEEKIKSYLQTRICRGKVDVYVEVQQIDEVCAEVAINHSLAQGYVNALRELAQRYDVWDDLSASLLARYPDILTVHKAQESEDKIWETVRPVLREATDRFVAMREAEGARLTSDIESRMKTILTNVGKIEERSPRTVEEYKNRLVARINELIGQVQIDPQRILTEAAIFADRIAVAEETVRLRSHIAEMAEMMESNGGIGRKLDFIVQELNREANTIGSKAQDAEIAHLVIEMKGEIEKIREQVQNIE
ncbi:MAG: YicC family protein [Clostridia bacterium]|nr:YicC family protein [Clostridia bacterium]